MKHPFLLKDDMSSDFIQMLSGDQVSVRSEALQDVVSREILVVACSRLADMRNNLYPFRSYSKSCT